MTSGGQSVVYIKSLKFGGVPQSSPLLATVSLTNQTLVAPFSMVQVGLQTEHQRRMLALAGPAEIQFQNSNVILELQRIQSTNVFTVFFDGSNGVTVNVPAGKTINFMPPFSWAAQNILPYPTAVATLSNSTTTLKDTLYGDESFSGPITITLVAGVGNLAGYTDGWVTYYFTEEFSALPSLGATIVPIGKSMISIEKSFDLVNWSPVYIKPITSEQKGFFRFNFSK